MRFDCLPFTQNLHSSLRCLRKSLKLCDTSLHSLQVKRFSALGDSCLALAVFIITWSEITHILYINVFFFVIYVVYDWKHNVFICGAFQQYYDKQVFVKHEKAILPKFGQLPVVELDRNCHIFTLRPVILTYNQVSMNFRSNSLARTSSYFEKPLFFIYFA